MLCALQERVEALARALVGGTQQQKLVQADKGVENILCADGFDPITKTHKVRMSKLHFHLCTPSRAIWQAPKLTKREVLDKFRDVIAKVISAGPRAILASSCNMRYPF